MNFCPNCGQSTGPNVRFCSSCGTDIQNPGAPRNSNNPSVNFGMPFGAFWRNYFGYPFSKLATTLEEAKQPALAAFFIFLISFGGLILMTVITTNKEYGEEMKFEDIMKFMFLCCLVITITASLLMLFKLMFGVKDINFGKDILAATLSLASVFFLYIILMFFTLLQGNKRYGGLGSPFDTLDMIGRTESEFLAIIMLSVMLLFIFKAINVIVQSFKSQKVPDSLAMYFSPLVFMLGLYLGFKLGIEILD